MKKLACMIALLFSASLNAAVITTSVAAFDGFDYTGTDYYYDLDDFSFDLMGETIVSATLSGTWGETDTYSGSTAHAELYVDGMMVADTHDPALACDPYSCVTTWSYVFTDFTSLMDGFLDFAAIQTSYYVLRLGETTLSITTEPTRVPEPGPLVLLGFGLLAYGMIRRSKAKR